MLKINKKDILALYNLVMDTTGGRKGIRDEGLLDSAINSAYQTFDKQDIYPSVEEKAARMGYGLIANHSFIDGNKRIGILVMLTYLNVNGINIKCSDKTLINLGMSLASGQSNYTDLLKWINKHKVKTQKSDLDTSIEM